MTNYTYEVRQPINGKADYESIAVFQHLDDALAYVKAVNLAKVDYNHEAWDDYNVEAVSLWSGRIVSDPEGHLDRE